MIRRSAAITVALVIAGHSLQGQDPALPASALSVRRPDGSWREFWNSRAAPVRWSAEPFQSWLRWRGGAPGVKWAEVSLRGTAEAWRTRLVVARLDPSQLRFALDTAFNPRREAAWTLAHASHDAVFAVNAGQFEATIPWGWVVLNGKSWLPAQHGPLAPALLQDSSGALHWVRGDSVPSVASRAPPRWAFQSYPALLDDGAVLEPLRSSGHGVDVAHRDARAAICLTRDGHLLVALTRFDAAGPGLGFIPFGLTVPEMAGVLGALGCRDAMLLDGGISARLRVRDVDGSLHDWEGLRAVPLALLAFPRLDRVSLGDDRPWRRRLPQYLAR